MPQAIRGAKGTKAPAVPARLEKAVTASAPVFAVDLLAQHCDLSKGAIKDAMQKGAVWLSRGVHADNRSSKTRPRRLRRAKTPLKPGDEIAIYYDAHVLKQRVTPPVVIADEGGYSVWDTPAGMLSQGSKFGDHCALTRWIEKNSEPPRKTYLVHRLDRAASGLMLIAHDSKTAAALSALFRDRKVEKTYAVTVGGEFDKPLPFRIDMPLDGKAAVSTVLSANTRQAPAANSRPNEEVKSTPQAIEDIKTTLRVGIETGRKHQIRRHLAELGFPVVGDALYGNALPRSALALRAVSLAFKSPLDSAEKRYQLAEKAQEE